MTRDLFQLGYQAEERIRPWDWGHRNIRLRDSPYGDRFLPEETPWLKEPLETLEDVTVQECVLMCAAQTGKTVTMLVALCWALEKRPGFTMFAAQHGDAAKFIAQQKIIPAVESIPSLAAALPEGKKRHQKSTRQILFPAATLLIGPANEGFFRGYTVEWFFGDEPSAWKPGKMDQGRARTTRVWNRKIFFASTPLEANSDFAKAYGAGDQRKYHMAAPCCGEPLYLGSDNLEKLIQWDSNETTKPNGEWNYRAWRETVRLVCPKCGAQHKQTDALYRQMLAGAKYVRTNPNAPAERVSFAFNVFCLPPSIMSWAAIAEMWLRAKEEENKGNLAPLKEFVTLRLAEPWDERKFTTFTFPDFEQYDPNSEWSEERFRSLTVDCQEHLAEFWAVARAWGKDGSSRLLGFARLHTEAEIIEFQKTWRIPAHLVALDCAYMPASVFDMCVRNGWCAMRGDDRRDFLNQVMGPAGEMVATRQPYMQSRGDPRNGKNYAGRSYCIVWIWSNPTIKDITWNLKEGKGSPWAVREMGPELSELYAKGLDSERKREEIDRYGRTVLRWKKIRAHNHPWDCENMQTVFASLAKLFVFSIDAGQPPAAEAGPS